MPENKRSAMKTLELIFEGAIWRTRFIVILAVIFGLVGAIILFVVASLDILHMAGYVTNTLLSHAHPENFHEDIVAAIIGSVDLYLIAVVMFIFSFGLYELFISEIDEADKEGHSKILAIHSLDELKDKLAKVIIMVLIVSFFKRAMHIEYDGPIEMLTLAGAILALALSFYFMHKGGNH